VRSLCSLPLLGSSHPVSSLTENCARKFSLLFPKSFLFPAFIATTQLARLLSFDVLTRSVPCLCGRIGSRRGILRNPKALSQHVEETSKLSFSLDYNHEHLPVEVGLNYGSTVHLFRSSEYNFLGRLFASGTRPRTQPSLPGRTFSFASGEGSCTSAREMIVTVSAFIPAQPSARSTFQDDRRSY
jgi:hypothetical protein